MALYRWGFDRDAIEAAAKTASAKVTALKISGAKILVETNADLDAVEQRTVTDAITSAFLKLVQEG